MTDSYIETKEGHTIFVGPDATRLFQATALRSAIRMWVNVGVKANRAFTPSAMAATAGAITGKSYGRTKPELKRAYVDLTEWINAIKAAMPVVDGNKVSLANMNPAAMAAAARNAKKD